MSTLATAAPNELRPLLPPSIERIRAALRSVCAGRPIQRVEVFGSVARGESQAGSDVDLLIDFLPGARIGLFEMGALKEDLEEELGCKVDLLSRKAVETSPNPYRRHAILASPVTVYAR
jgi:hypothetical protein